MILIIGWYAVVITATLVLLIMLWQFRAAIALFLLSLAIAATLRPIIHKLSSGRRLSRSAALAIIYSLLVGGILIGWLVIGPPLLRDLQQATNDFFNGYEYAKQAWPEDGTVFQKMLAQQLPPADEFYNSLTTKEGFSALEGVFGAASGLFSFMGFLMMSIILSIYWSADQFRFERLGLSLLPADQHPRALKAWRSVETGVGAYIRSEFVQSAVALIVLGLGYAALGLNYPVLLAIWVAVARLIPWFGALIALTPTIPIWSGISPSAGFIYAVFTLTVLILIRRTIQSRIFEIPHYNSLPTLLLLIALAEGFGLIGILLAPLLGLALRILMQDINLVPRGRFSPEVNQKSAQLLERLSALQANMEDNSAEESKVLINRLQALARDARDYFRDY